MAATPTPSGARTPWQVTRSVWFALFMREAVARTMADRFAWFWLLFEPIALVVIMTAIRTVIRSGNIIVGANYVPWLVVGLLGFFLFREGMMRSMGAVEANRALLAYRQVMPIDPVLVRIFLEGVLRTLVLSIFIVAGLLLGYDMFPDQMLLAICGWLSLWALGAGTGLTLSVVGALIPEVARSVRILSIPLLIISGVIFPLHVVPHGLLEILMYNPIAHGLEFLRLGFFEGYKMVQGASLLYIWLFALGFLSLGLTVHVRYADVLQAR